MPTVDATRVLKIHYKYAVNRGRNYDFGVGDNNSCIITMSPIPPMSSTTRNQENECVNASTHSGENGARGAYKFSSRTAPKGTELLQQFLKNATSLNQQSVDHGSATVGKTKLVTS